MIDRVGELVEILPGYDSETGECSIWDEYAGCAGRIVKVWTSDDTADVVLLDGREVNVSWRRLRFRPPT